MNIIPAPLKNLTRLHWLIVALFIIAVAGAVFLIFLTKSRNINILNPAQKEIKVDYRKEMNLQINKTFSKPEQKQIIEVITLADNEKNYQKAYDYYIQAYNLMANEYKSSNDPSIKAAMDKLEGYLIAFPQFLREDLTKNN